MFCEVFPIMFKVFWHQRHWTNTKILRNIHQHTKRSRIVRKHNNIHMHSFIDGGTVSSMVIAILWFRFVFPSAVHKIIHMLCRVMYPLVSPCIPLYPLVSPCIPLYPLISSCIPLYPLISPCIPLYPLVSPYIPLYPLVFPCIPLYPL